MSGEQVTLRKFIRDIEESSNEEKRISVNSFDVVKKIRERPWRLGSYRKQNWGIWLHRMSPYVGKMKPAMAHCLLKAATLPGQIVLDPFCGVGTVPLEADIIGRIGIGMDLNPYAAMISMAKFDRHPLGEHIQWLRNLELKTAEVCWDEIPPIMKEYLHERTLKELYALKRRILEENRIFLLGCLLGILHGHRRGHLSVYTSLVIPFKPIHTPPYKEVIPRLIDKVKRMYRDPFPLNTKSFALPGDARYLPLPEESVDVIISSPPYYNTLDYVQDNRLRLEFLGINDSEKEYLNTILIQKPEKYLDDMEEVGTELMKILKPKGLCIYVLGDCHKGQKHIKTADEVSLIYEKIGFIRYAIIEDEMPPNPSFPTSYKRRKLDRILVMQKPE
jgi:DNA modification methylase